MTEWSARPRGRGATASRPRCKGVVSWGHVDTVTRGQGEMHLFQLAGRGTMNRLWVFP